MVAVELHSTLELSFRGGKLFVKSNNNNFNTEMFTAYLAFVQLTIPF